MITTEASRNVEGEPGQVALLVDTDNAKPAYRHEIEEAAERHGQIVQCLAFGGKPSKKWQKDGALPALKWHRESWPTSGKNAADILLAVTAADLRHTTDIECFCIVSGDSDFAELANYLRGAGKMVVGMGEKKRTAKAFRQACDVFEVLGRKKARTGRGESKTPPGESGAASLRSPGTKTTATESMLNRATSEDTAERSDRRRFLELVEKVVGNGKPKWRRIGWLGEELRRLDPEIRYREFGTAKLGALLKTFPGRIEVRGKKGPMEFRLVAR